MYYIYVFFLSLFNVGVMFLIYGIGTLNHWTENAMFSMGYLWGAIMGMCYTMLIMHCLSKTQIEGVNGNEDQEET